MSRLDSREYDWFILCVPPQREFVVGQILANAGFATFVPARTKWRFGKKAGKGRLQKREVRYALMPRYVFCGMGPGTPGWYGMLKYRIITSILHLDGEPYQVPSQAVRDMMWRLNHGEFRAPGAQQYMVSLREFEVGDKVLTEDGLFEGRVKEIAPPFARVLIEILGSSREVLISLEKLVTA